APPVAAAAALMTFFTCLRTRFAMRSHGRRTMGTPQTTDEGAGHEDPFHHPRRGCDAGARRTGCRTGSCARRPSRARPGVRRAAATAALLPPGAAAALRRAALLRPRSAPPLLPRPPPPPRLARQRPRRRAQPLRPPAEQPLPLLSPQGRTAPG